MIEVTEELLILRDQRSVKLGPIGEGHARAYCDYMLALAIESPWSGMAEEEVRSEEEQREKFAEMAKDGGIWQVGVFEVGTGQMIGDCVWKRPEYMKFAHVASLGIGIRDGWRGLGLGRMLMERAILAAREDERVQKLELGVFSQNKVAFNLYRSLGFIEEGCRVRAVRQVGGVYEDDILMGLWVGD